VCGFSVSAGSRGTISKHSLNGSSPPVACLSHWASAAALAASGSMLDAAGALETWVSALPSTADIPAFISVSPAWARVGSETASEVSVSGGAGWACATSSTQASSAAKGASSSAACLTWESTLVSEKHFSEVDAGTYR
jgi:hypothetical protein